MYLDRYQRKLILLQAKILELKSEKDNPPLSLKYNQDFTGGTWVSKKRDDVLKTEIYFCCNEKKHNFDAQIAIKDLKRCINGGSATTTLPRFDSFCTELFQSKFEEHPNPISDEGQKLGVFTFGELIGFTRAETRFLLDNHFASHFPTYSTFSDTHGFTTDFITEHGGIYSLYRYDKNDATKALGYPMGVILCCRLSVRYPVPFKHVDSEGRQSFRVRCKLNIPGYMPRKYLNTDAEKKIFKCDGYVSLRGKNWWQWLFQIRKLDDKNSDDLVLMYTDSRENKFEDFKFRSVKLLHQDQSDTLVPTFSDAILCRHQEYFVEKTDIRKNIKFSGLPYLENYFEMKRGDSSNPEELKLGERPLMRECRLVDPLDEDRWGGLEGEFEFDKQPIRLLLDRLMF